MSPSRQGGSGGNTLVVEGGAGVPAQHLTAALHKTGGGRLTPSGLPEDQRVTVKVGEGR